MSGYILRLIYYLVIAFAIGSIAQLITGYHKRRTFTTLILGFVGVVTGDFLSYRFKLPDVFFFGISIFWSILGAVVFILLFRLIRGRW